MSASAVRMSGRDLMLLGFLTLSWGANWPVMKLGVGELAPMTFRAISMLGGLPVLWLVVRSQRLSIAVPRAHWRELFVLGTTNMVVWFVLIMYAVDLLASGRAAILGYTMPIWVAIIGFAVYGERPSRRLGVGVVAAAFGVALLLAGEIGAIAGSPLGTLLAIAAAMVWGFGTHLMRRRTPSIHVLVVTFWSLALSLVVCLSIAIVSERDQWTGLPGPAGWWALAYNALVILGLSQAIWFRIASTLPPVASGLSVMLIPVVGVFSAMAMLGEMPNWRDWVALACIVIALAAVLLPTNWMPRR